MSILAAIDGDKGSDGIVTTGWDLAAGLGENLIVLHVRRGEVRQERQEERAQVIVEDALGENADEAELVFREGDPANEILEAADEYAARYVVLGSRKRTPIGKVLFGSVTQLVMANASVPVVNVEQEGGGAYPIETGLH